MHFSFRVEKSLRMTRLGIFAIMLSFVASLGLAIYCIREVNKLARFDALSAVLLEEKSEYLRAASGFLRSNSALEKTPEEFLRAVKDENKDDPLLFVPSTFQPEPLDIATEYALKPVNAILGSQLTSFASSSSFLDFTGSDPNVQVFLSSPVVAVDPATGTYLLVWKRVHRTEPPLYDLVAQRVGDNGQLLDAEPFPIVPPQSRESVSPKLVYGHGMFFLTWHWSGASDIGDDWNGVAFARIATDGTVLDPGGREVARRIPQNCNCGNPSPTAPVPAAVADGFLLVWHHASHSGGVSGGASELAGALVIPNGDIGPIRSFFIVQPGLSGPFVLSCNTADRCVFLGNWRGNSPVLGFSAQEFNSSEWRVPNFRGCERPPSPCGTPMIWDSGGRIDLAVLPDGSFIAAWESIDASYGTRNGIMLERISSEGALMGEPFLLPDSEQYHLPRFGDPERLFFHSGNFTTFPFTERDAFRVELDLSAEAISTDSLITPLSEEPIELLDFGLFPACSAQTCLAAWGYFNPPETIGLRAWHSSRNIRPTNEELAARFAPILIMDSEEKFLPISREDYLTVTDLKTRKVSWAGIDIVETLETEPTLEALIQPELVCPDAGLIRKALERCEDWFYFLDVEGAEPSDFSALDDYSTIQQVIMAGDKKPTIYWHVTNYVSGEIAIQYWFFYLYNDFTNSHESDWEQITIHLDSEFNALEAAYASHTSPGQKRFWGNIILTDDHPYIYVANGSHASYFSPGSNPAVICQTLSNNKEKVICSETVSDYNDGNGDFLIPSSMVVEEGLFEFAIRYALNELYGADSLNSFVFRDGDYGSGNYFQVVRRKDKSTDPRLREEWDDPLQFVDGAEMSI